MRFLVRKSLYFVSNFTEVFPGKQMAINQYWYNVYVMAQHKWGDKLIPESIVTQLTDTISLA